MRLTLHPVDAAPQAFWVTRRYWLVLLRRLRAVAGQAGVELSPPVTTQPGRNSRPSDFQVVPPDPVLLEGLRVLADCDGARILLIAGRATRDIRLNAVGLVQMEEMVALQAERAGWDPEPAMERLCASEMAKAALGRAGEASPG